MKCETCIHYNICVVTSYCHERCGYYEEERPHGEWIRTGRTNVYGGFEIECSNCHTKLMVSPSRWEIGENFYDVCGADMRKEGDEENQNPCIKCCRKLSCHGICEKRYLWNLRKEGDE